MTENQMPWDKEHDELGQASFAGDFVPFDAEYTDGVHELVVKDLTTVTQPNKFKNNEPQTRLKWTFAPADYTGEGGLSLWTSMSTHKKANFPPVCVALGVEVPTPENPAIRKSMFIGKRCRGLLLNEPSTKDPGKKFLKIKQLLPLA